MWAKLRLGDVVYRFYREPDTDTDEDTLELQYGSGAVLCWVVPSNALSADDLKEDLTYTRGTRECVDPLEEGTEINRLPDNTVFVVASYMSRGREFTHAAVLLPKRG